MQSDTLERVADGHLDDADLLRHLDAERALPAVGDPAPHLRDCVPCAARAELLRRRRLALTRLLAECDTSTTSTTNPEALLARARSRERPRWYALPAARAAAVLLVAGSLAAQPTVRHWLATHWTHAHGSTERTRREPVIGAPRAMPAAATTGSVLSFEPASGLFVIRFDVPPAAGFLTIVHDSGALATVERLDGANPEVLVTMHGLRVRNSATDTLRYRVRLPRTVPRVSVRTVTTPNERMVDVSDRAQRIDFAPASGTP